MDNTNNTTQTATPVVQTKEITLNTVLDSYLKGNRVAPTIAFDITGIFDSNPEHPEVPISKGKSRHYPETVRTNQKDLDKINEIIRDNKLTLMCFKSGSGN